MSTIRETDCRLLLASPEDVYHALLDFGSYRKWWPKAVGLDVLRGSPLGVGSRANVYTTGGRFTCEVVSAIPEREIVVQYTGIHQGTATWTIEPEGDGAYVRYTLEAEVHGAMPRLLARVVDFRRIHGRLVGQVLDALERYLSRTRREGSAALAHA